jgi:hypothetical protein
MEGNRQNPAGRPRLRIVAVKCPRTGCMRTIEQHRACPYCFGTVGDILAVDRRRFCDYQPRVDAVCFGFPEAMTRYNG